MYSARKNIANFSDEYSVWKPPTISPSPSGRSNGIRFDSPIMVTMYVRNEGISSTAYQMCRWPATISDVDIDPANMNTATNDRPIAISYEITWALDRRPPSSEY